MTLLTFVLCVVTTGSGCGKSTIAGSNERATALRSTPVAALSAPAPAPPEGAPRSPVTTPGAASVPPPSVPPPRTIVTRRPSIVQSPIPFGPRRKAEMVAYALRHYHLDSYRLANPHVVVIHYTETPDFQSTFNTFASDVPDSELHELPNTCAHFVIDTDGTIHQLVPLGIMCRHTVGLNWTAIGIEHVGYSDGEVLRRPRQIAASLHLVHWLRCRFHIPIVDVIGHNESLSSHYHHEDIPALRTQTHSDFNHADMQIYRSRLRAAGSCQ